MLKPVRVITVEREYGSHGAEFAHDLAHGLGWKLLDSELVTGAARKAGIDPKAAARFDEKLDPWYYRYGKFLWQDPIYVPVQGSGGGAGFRFGANADPHWAGNSRAEKEGNCVIVGRGAACALVGHPGSFHVLCMPRRKPSAIGTAEHSGTCRPRRRAPGSV